MTTSETNIIKDRAKRPTVVVMISIFYLLVGFITTLANTLSIAVHLVGSQVNGKGQPFSALPLLFVGIISGILMIIAGVGLWKLRRWAYQMAVAISGLLVLINLIALFIALSRGQSSISYMAIIFHGLIVVGLFSKSVKAIFTSA